MKQFLGLITSLGALPLAAMLGCGGGDGTDDIDVPPLFEPQPECEGDPVVAYAGDAQNVIAFIEIGGTDDGFDLDGNGTPDNKLAAAGSLAREPIEDALQNFEIMIPFEFFDLDSSSSDECVKFGIYLGDYRIDGDEDGEDTAIEGGDCDDTTGQASPDLAEVPGNRFDDDCDGLADEVDDGSGGQVPPDDDGDLDGDGVTLGQGDCDDTALTGAAVTPGEPEICGDRRDNDCSGVADRGTSQAPGCDPYDLVAEEQIVLDPLSFDGDGDPVIAFTNGTIEGGVLTAGPSIFSVQVPVIDDLVLDLRISGAQIIADVMSEGDQVWLENGRLGGVIDARTADGIRGLDVPDIGLEPQNSLLDAVFASNVIGPLLALQTLPAESGFPMCRTPDIDVDQDGLEGFCDSNTDDDVKTVDLCIDGDGTQIFDEVDGAGNVITECTAALEPDDDRPRFLDGISVELNFSTVPTQLAE
jgi:hypothetical protein